MLAFTASKTEKEVGTLPDLRIPGEHIAAVQRVWNGMLRYEVFMPSFWNWPCAAPNELDFTLIISIGEFGPGSDAPIVLDYRANGLEPRAMYLKQRWTEKYEPDNHWCEAAPTFRDFALQVGLARA